MVDLHAHELGDALLPQEVIKAFGHTTEDGQGLHATGVVGDN